MPYCKLVVGTSDAIVRLVAVQGLVTRGMAGIAAPFRTSSNVLKDSQYPAYALHINMLDRVLVKMLDKALAKPLEIVLAKLLEIVLAIFWAPNFATIDELGWLPTLWYELTGLP
jgi:hypothetical protein